MLREDKDDEFGWGAEEDARREQYECHHVFPNGDMPDNEDDVCRLCKRTAKEIWGDNKVWEDE